MIRTEWAVRPKELRLPEEEQVHVWRVPLVPEAARRLWDSVLSEEELRRAHRFAFEQDRHTYTMTRGILRTLLGEYLGLPPQAVRFVYSPTGKPSVDPRQSHTKLTFNVSHSHRFSLLAFGVATEVGVDLEALKDENVAEIAQMVLSAQEYGWLMELPDTARAFAFLRLWTHKEAIVKAVGCGLSAPVRNIEVVLPPTEPIKLRHGIPEMQAIGDWSLRDLDVHPEYRAALAVRSRRIKVRTWDWE